MSVEEAPGAMTVHGRRGADQTWVPISPGTGGGPSELPPGGAAGEVLAKASPADRDVEWISVGAATSGLPDGGATGEVLAKASDADQDVEWVPAAAGGAALPPGGDAGEVLAKASDIDGDVEWTETADRAYVDAIVDAAVDQRVMKSGDTMTGDLIVGATGWPSFVGLSGDLNGAAIELHGEDFAGVNFTAGAPAMRRWSFGATTLQAQDMDLEVVRWNGGAIESVPLRINRAGGVQAEEELFLHKNGDLTGVAPAIRWADDGGNLAWVYAARSGTVGGPSLIFRTEDPDGAHTLMRSRPGNPAIAGDPSRLELMGEPIEPQDAATKAYVDARISGALTLIGAFNASTGEASFAPASGIPNGPLPAADPTNANSYVIVTVAGTPPQGPPETQVHTEVGDWWISDGMQWLHLAVGGGAVQAINVALIPPAFGANDVQTALTNADFANDALDVRVTVNEGDIADLQGRVAGAEGDLSALSDRVAVNEGGIADLDNRIAGLDGRMIGFDDGLAALDADKLDIAGGAMTGPLLLAGAPVLALEAVTKQYVDQVATGARLIVGTIDASTGLCVYTASSGLPNGPLVEASVAGQGADVICSVAGRVPPAGPLETWGQDMQVGDMFVSDGTQWVFLAIPHVAAIASAVAVVPPAFGADNVQEALEQAEVQSLPRGGTFGQILAKLDPVDFNVGWVDSTGFDDRTFFIERAWFNQAGPDVALLMGCDAINIGLGATPFLGVPLLTVYRSGANLIQEGFDRPNPNPGNIVSARWVRQSANGGATWGPWSQIPVGENGSFLRLTGGTITGPLQIATDVEPQLQIVGSEIRIRALTGGSWSWRYDGAEGAIRWRFTSEAPQTTDVLILDAAPGFAATFAGAITAPGLTVNGDAAIDGDTIIAGDATIAGNVSSAPLPTDNAHLVNKAYVDALYSQAAILSGIINAATGQCGFVDGTTGPAPDPQGTHNYFICTIPGTIPTGPAAGITMRIGDELYDASAGPAPSWVLIAVGTGGLATTADQIALVPTVAGGNNVQIGMQNLEAQKVARAGDTGMTGPLQWANTLTVAPPSNAVNSAGRRLSLWNSAPGSDFGLGIESGALWINAGSATSNLIKFYIFAAERFRIGNAGNISYTLLNMNDNFITNLRDPGSSAADAANKRYVDAQRDTRVAKSGDTITGNMTHNGWIVMKGTATGSNCHIHIDHNPNTGNNAYNNSLLFRDDAARNLAQIYSQKSAVTGGVADATTKFYNGSGGYGFRFAFELRTASPPQMYVDGNVSCGSFTNRCLRATKATVRSAARDEHRRAFDALKVRRFTVKDEQVPFEKNRERWGFVAEELPEEVVAYAAPGVSDPKHPAFKNKVPEGLDLAQALAVAVAEIKRLGAEVEALKARVH